MRLHSPLLILAFSLLGSSANCSEEMDSFPDASLSADQWQQRVMDARRRSEEYIAGLRAGTASAPSFDQGDAEAANERAMRDPDLQRGDIIATSKGLFVFTGSDRDERTPADFLPVPRR
jgi:hypothetical protein